MPRAQLPLLRPLPLPRLLDATARMDMMASKRNHS